MLKAILIHGQGDKIALPPSMLEFLMATSLSLSDDGSRAEESLSSLGRLPWIFCIGIPNPNYTFPTSLLMQSLQLEEEDDPKNHKMEENNDDDNDDNAAKQKHWWPIRTNCSTSIWP